MKRLNKEKREAWIRYCKARKIKRERRINRKKRHTKKRRHKKAYAIVINAPTVFELRNRIHRKNLLEFLDELRDKVLHQKKKVKIDFSNTTSLVVCGTLRFWSELHYIKNELGSLDLLSCSCPTNETVAKALKHLGMLEMLGCLCNIVPDGDDVITWKYATGVRTDTEEVGKILEEQLPKSKSKKLYRGVSEAMTNVSQHAYLKDSKTKGWWMFYREEGDRIIVAFCDLGVGIPVTLPQTIERNNEQNSFIQICKDFFQGKKKLNDSQLIHAAIEVGRTRTKKQHRGKGLSDVVRVLENTQDGKLTILSNMGGYINNFGNKPETKNYHDSIDGTLILWSLPLSTKF